MRLPWAKTGTALSDSADSVALPADLATFACASLRARVTRRGCAKLWNAAQERRPEPWEMTRAACLWIGAQPGPRPKWGGKH